MLRTYSRSPLDVFLEKDVLKIRSKFTGEHPCQGAISIKLQSNFTETALRHGYCSLFIVGKNVQIKLFMCLKKNRKSHFLLI